MKREWPNDHAKSQQREPHDCASNKTLGTTIWWYEEHGGIGLYANWPPHNIGKRIALIPWRSLRAALKRKDRS